MRGKRKAPKGRGMMCCDDVQRWWMVVWTCPDVVIAPLKGARLAIGKGLEGARHPEVTVG